MRSDVCDVHRGGNICLQRPHPLCVGEGAAGVCLPLELFVRTLQCGACQFEGGANPPLSAVAEGDAGAVVDAVGAPGAGAAPAGLGLSISMLLHHISVT